MCHVCLFADDSEEEVEDYASDFVVIQDTDVLWLEVQPGDTFQSQGHLPVIAGRSASGKEQYIIGIQDDPAKPLAGWTEYRLWTASDGESEVEFFDLIYYTWRKSSRFAVLVLRFDPNIYPATNDIDDDSNDGEKGTDATGPLIWRSVVNQCAECT